MWKSASQHRFEIFLCGPGRVFNVCCNISERGVGGHLALHLERRDWPSELQAASDCAMHSPLASGTTKHLEKPDRHIHPQARNGETGT